MRAWTKKLICMDLQVQLVENPYSWNQIANVLYIDSPCGVGMSYGTNLPADYETNDNVTAVDSYMFLQGFFDVSFGLN